MVFSIQDRDKVRDHVVGMAQNDARIVGGATIGSLALGEGDRWSDIDLTFAVRDGVPIVEVLEDWSAEIIQAFDAAHLFDLPSGPLTYRVFLLPGCLQVDLSFAPALEFRPRGPKFQLIFGEAKQAVPTKVQPSTKLFGLAVHHALRARFSIERGRHWQAQYWIGAARDLVLTLACRANSLPDARARGYDDLPADLRAAMAGTLPASLDSKELLRTLAATIRQMIIEGENGGLIDPKIKFSLEQLTVDWA
jgi:hypothetical protein